MNEAATIAVGQPIYENSPSIQRQFDDLLRDELEAISIETEKALLSLKEYGVSEASRDSEGKINAQVAYGVTLLHKCVNDIIASCQMLRLGRVDWAHGILRSAIESLCMAILVIKDNNVLERYRTDKFPVNKSLTRLIPRASNLEINSNFLKILKEIHDSTKRSMHPTLVTLKSNMFLHDNAAKWSIGGHFDSNKNDDYKAIATSLSGLAAKMTEFIKTLL